jgi:hypothetical protein
MEQFRDILGYEGFYQVSNLGTVRSLDRTYVGKGGSLYPLKGIIMKQKSDRYGYMTIGLRDNKKRKDFLVHRLVANAFIENIDNKRSVNHIDGNKKNNNLSNLEWVTDKENSIHAYKTGLLKLKYGEDSKKSKLKTCDILAIRENKNNISQEKLAKQYNVGQPQIWRIVNRINWSHVN